MELTPTKTERIKNYQNKGHRLFDYAFNLRVLSSAGESVFRWVPGAYECGYRYVIWNYTLWEVNVVDGKSLTRISEVNGKQFNLEDTDISKQRILDFIIKEQRTKKLTRILDK